jgi:hypothetical protein
MHNSDGRRSSRRLPQHRQSSRIKDGYLQGDAEDVLPRHGWIYAIIIGGIGGIIALAVPVTITLINTSLFNQAASAASKGSEGMSDQMAVSLLGWQCFGAFIELSIAFAIGIVAGRIIVKFWSGPVAGAMAGFVFTLGIFLSQYIPGYPGVITTGTTGPLLQYVWAFIIQLLVYAPIGAIMSLGGAWVIIRTYPHYR